MEEPKKSDEEWEEMQRRFDAEGLNSQQLSSKQKSIHLWRWLVDAENNMVTSRKMLDKVREQQSEEMKEVETFVQHIRNLSSEKIENLEKENGRLQQEVNELLQRKATDCSYEEVTKMITKEGLTEIMNSSLEEQVAYLLVLRSRLMEELEVEKNRTSSAMSTADDDTKQNTPRRLLEEQSNFEEDMKRQQELTKQVKEEMKKNHDVEIAAFQAKLDVAQKKIEEFELESEQRKREVHYSENDVDSEDVMRLREKLSQMEDRLRKMQHSKRQLEIDNESLTFKVSELLTECEEKESHLRREYMKKVGAKPYSRQNSTCDSPKKLLNNLDNKTLNELSWQQQIRKLQQDVENLQDQLANVGGRHEALVMRYQQRKVDGKSKMQRIKDVFHAKQTNLKDQICDLENSLSVVQTTLGWEKECRQKIQSDFAILQREKGDLTKKYMDCDSDLRDKTMHMKALGLRVNNLEEENAKISQEMAILKTLVLKDVFLSSSATTQKDSKETIASQWLNKLHQGTNTLSKNLDKRKDLEEVTV